MNCSTCGQENPVGAQFCNRCGGKLTPAMEPMNANEGVLVTSRDFVGRQQELSDLRAALDDAVSGRGRLVMLVGEPSIGKTRTAQELAANAESQGVQVLWGRCYEGEGAPGN